MRRRLTLLSGLAVAVTVVVASAIAYFAVQRELRGEVDNSLRQAGRVVARFSDQGAPPQQLFQERLREGQALPAPGPRPSPLGGPRQSAQIVDADGQVLAALGEGGEFPSSKVFREVAAGERDATFLDARTDGDHLRVYVRPRRQGRGPGLGSVGHGDRRGAVEPPPAAAVRGDRRNAWPRRCSVVRWPAPRSRRSPGSRRALGHVAETSDLARRIEVGGPDETRCAGDPVQHHARCAGALQRRRWARP